MPSNPMDMVKHLGAILEWPVSWDEWKVPLYIGFRTYRSPESNRIFFLAAFQCRMRFESILMYGKEPKNTFLIMASVADLYHEYLRVYPTMLPFYRLSKALRTQEAHDLSYVFYNVSKASDIWQEKFNWS